MDGNSAVFSAGTDGTGSWTVTIDAGRTIATPSIRFAQTGGKTLSGGTFVIGGGTFRNYGFTTVTLNGTLSNASGADVVLNYGTTLNVDTGAITMTTANWYKTVLGATGKLTSSTGTLTVTNGATTGDLTTTNHQIQVQIADFGATALALVKNNRNNLVLGQANTYTGGATVNDGRIESKNLSAFGTGAVTVNNGGQVFFTQGGVYPNDFIINGNGVTEAGSQFGALRFSGFATTGGGINVASASRVSTYAAADTGIIADRLTVNSGTLKLDTSLSGLTAGENGIVAGEGTAAGTLTMTGTADDNFDLAGGVTYRDIPVFNDTGSAITLTIPCGADLVWRGDDATNPGFWDPNTTANWAGSVTNPDTFFTGDSVVFDDTGLGGPDVGQGKVVSLKGLYNPAKVTFNNSSSGNYSIEGGTGVGFTGGTSIVKNGTSTVTINNGILKAGGYELLGNASSVIINSNENGSGQLDINGKNLGNGSRHYSMTIAGAGLNGAGAITNTATASSNENAGILNLTLGADASICTTGGRYDIGRSGGEFGTISGNGHTLTKAGAGIICMRAPPSTTTAVMSRHGKATSP